MAMQKMEHTLTGLPVEVKYFISSNLDQTSLASLVQCSRIWREVSTNHLYETNAQDDNSSAILWVLLKGSPRRTVELVWRLSVKNGGDVNAIHVLGPRFQVTALHVVAADCNAELVDILLRYGAETDIPAQGLLNLRRFSDIDIDTKFNDVDLAKSVIDHFWNPLLMPLLLRNESVTTLLVEAGAPQVVSIGDEEIIDPPATVFTNEVTVAHVVAADCMMRITTTHPLYRLFRQGIDSILPLNGSTPLQVAMKARNDYAFNELLTIGASLELPGILDRTALMSAIAMLYGADGATQKGWYKAAIERLIVEGANVNAAPITFSGETPLILALQAASEEDWPQLHREVKFVVTTLINCGVNINGRSYRRFTPVQELARSIISRGGNSSLERLLDMFIDEGGKVNKRTPYGKSLLFFALSQKGKQIVPNLVRILLRANARLEWLEADCALVAWANSKKLRGAFEAEGISIGKYSEYFTQRGINVAYLSLFKQRDAPAYLAFQSHFPMFTMAEQLVCITLQDASYKGMAEKCGIFDREFHATYRQFGDSLLHLLVKTWKHNLETKKGPRVTQPLAVKYSKILIAKGASPVARDSMGDSPGDVVRGCKPQGAQLLKVLDDAVNALPPLDPRPNVAE